MSSLQSLSILLRARSHDEPVLYVASRASLPARPAMWRQLRDEAGWCILSSWIDEAGVGETDDLQELWQRIETEIALCDGLILYVEEEDFPLKGALVEVGMALARDKPVAIVLGRDLKLEAGTLRPLGSWAWHPLCMLHHKLDAARDWLRQVHKKDQAARWQVMRDPDARPKPAHPIS